MAQEYSRFDIRSLVVAPGMLNTGLGKAASPETVQNKIDHSLLGTGNARSVAQPIAFLVGPEADHINGTVVRIDGGLRY